MAWVDVVLAAIVAVILASTPAQVWTVVASVAFGLWTLLTFFTFPLADLIELAGAVLERLCLTIMAILLAIIAYQTKGVNLETLGKVAAGFGCAATIIALFAGILAVVSHLAIALKRRKEANAIELGSDNEAIDVTVDPTGVQSPPHPGTPPDNDLIGAAAALGPAAQLMVQEAQKPSEPENSQV